MFKEKKRSGSILIIAMLIMVVISGISVTVYSLGQSNQRQATSSANFDNVRHNAINAARFAIDNLKLTPQQASNVPPSCNSIMTCNAAPQTSGKIAFAWQQGVLESTLGRAPNLLNDGEALSFWQTYAYQVPGKPTDYVLVQINGINGTGILYNIVGYSNVNGNVATYNTTYYWAAASCDCISITSQPAALPGGNLAANYGYWWNNNSLAAQKAGGQIAYNGGVLYLGLPETNTVTKAWIDPTGGACCNTYCRWDYQTPVVGRYVDIYFDNDNTARTLNLQELEVYDQNGTNIALSKPATASSIYLNNPPNYIPDKLVDGIDNNLFQTGNEVMPWVRVDLGLDRQISKIVLLNRNTCCGDRIDGAVITVATNNHSEVFRYSFANGASTAVYTINPPTTNKEISNVTGRYVRLYHTTTANTGFNLREIQVFDANNTNIAATATVTLSSIGSGAANNLKDNNTATSVTTNDSQPWVLMDFGSNKVISRIVIDSAGSLNRARVAIIDGPSNNYVYTSAVFFNAPAGTYTIIPQIAASPSIPYAYICTTKDGERTVSVAPGNIYPRCVGYGERTGANINGTLTVPSTYVP